MLLKAAFADCRTNDALAVFLRELRGLVGTKLLSFMLYGSLAHGDFSPGYGDLDFMTVVDGQIDAATCDALIALRKPFRAGCHGEVAAMLEGAFLPREMLCPDVVGAGLWWGTTGERPINRNHLGWLNLLDIRQSGIVIFGLDLRSEIPQPTRSQLLNDVRSACRDIREHGEGGYPHSSDWLLQSARFLAFLREERLFTKSEAAEWAAQHASGDWRKQLAACSRYRRDAAFRTAAGTQSWLESLSAPIREACDEVERALSKMIARE